jgi:hypothetical protein
MTAERNESAAPRRGTSGLTWAVILIGAGLALLLQNMGVVQIDWLYLVRFWPVLLILAGLDFLVGRRSFAGGLLTAALGLAVVAGILWLASNPPNLPGWAGAIGRSTVTRAVQTELGEAQALEASLNLGATATTIGSHGDSEYALLGEYTTDERLDLAVDYQVQDGVGELRLEERGEQEPFSPGYTGRLDLTLTDAVPIDLSIDSGVGAATLDLEVLTLTALYVDTGVGSTEITLGEGSYTADINTGIGAVTIDLPEDAEVRVETDGGLGTTNVPNRFEKIDDETWETPGYSTATEQIVLRIDTGIGSVDIND